MPAALGNTFFRRDTLVVARELLGCSLCRSQPDGGIARWTITETEAYDGPQDKACHAHLGKTPRNSIMYAPGGVWYAYLCYGVHWLLNVITGPEDYPAAVLLRGAGPLEGPGRVTKALGIGRAENRLPVAHASGLWIEAALEPVPEPEVFRGPRVGMGKAAADWADKPYRFLWTTRWPGRLPRGVKGVASGATARLH